MSKKKATAISLPLSRTAKIMTSAVGVESVNPDIVALATKATEIFLMDFARRAYDQISEEEFKSNSLDYDDIQRLVHSDSRYDFLIDATPKRIKYSEALKLVEEAKEREIIRKEEETRWMDERRKELEKRKLENKLKQEQEEARKALKQNQREEEENEQKQTLDTSENNHEDEQQAEEANQAATSIDNHIKEENGTDHNEDQEERDQEEP